MFRGCGTWQDVDEDVVMMCVILLLHNLLLETNHYFQAVRSVSLVALMREADHGTVSIVTRASLIAADSIVIVESRDNLTIHEHCSADSGREGRGQNVLNMPTQPEPCHRNDATG